MFAERWGQVEESGLTLLLVPEALQGFGGSGEEAWLAFRLAGWHALDLPVPEAILAAHLLGASGLEIPAGPLTIAPRVTGSLDQVNGEWRFTGDFEAVPWAATRAISWAFSRRPENGLSFAPSRPRRPRKLHHANAADEPRDSLHYRDVAVACALCPGVFPDMRGIGALMRAAQISGACRGALELSLKQANERSQFGKPIGKFQAIQTPTGHAGRANRWRRSGLPRRPFGNGARRRASGNRFRRKSLPI